MSTKAALDAKRINAFAFDPDDLVIVGLDTKDGTEHALYDKRAFREPNEAGVIFIMSGGSVPTLEVRKDGDKAQVVDGRGRVIDAREANKRLRAKGEEPVLLEVRLQKGDDARIFGISRARNLFRTEDDPLTNAEHVEKYLAFGKSEDEAAVWFGVTPTAIRQWRKLSDLAAPVRKAIGDGKLSATAAAKLADLPRAEQVEKLDEMIAAAPAGKRVTAAAAKSVASKAKGGDGATPRTKRQLAKTIETIGGFTPEDHDQGEIEFANAFRDGIRYALGEIDAGDSDHVTAAMALTIAKRLAAKAEKVS